MSSREKIKSELLELAAERKKIVANSTAERLERSYLRERELQLALSDVGRQESSVRSNSKPPGKERELLAAIRENMTQERVIFTDIHGALPRQFIRADATSHFRATIDEKKTELDKMMSPFAKHPTAKPGRRIHALQEALETMEGDACRAQVAVRRTSSNRGLPPGCPQHLLAVRATFILDR